MTTSRPCWSNGEARARLAASPRPEPAQCRPNHGPRPRVGQQACDLGQGHPMRLMARLRRCAEPGNGTGQPDAAQLFGPETVIRHVTKTPIGPKAARIPDTPAGLFPHLTVQRSQCRLAGVYAAARQLKLRLGCVLKGQQGRAIPDQQSIGARTQAIGAATGRRSITRYHRAFFPILLGVTHRSRSNAPFSDPRRRHAKRGPRMGTRGMAVWPETQKPRKPKGLRGFCYGAQERTRTSTPCGTRT